MGETNDRNDRQETGAGPQLPARRQEERRSLGPTRPRGPDEPLWTDEGIDWQRLAFVLWRKKIWVLAAGALGIAAGVFLARQTSLTYETHASLWLESTERESGPIQGSQVLQGQGWAGLFSSLEILKPVVRDFKLYLDPTGDAPPREELFATARIADEESLRPGSYDLETTADGYRLAHKELGVLETASRGEPIGESIGLQWVPPVDSLRRDKAIRFKLSSVAQAALSLKDNISVVHNPGSGSLIHTHLKWDDPEQGARLHNAVVDTFMQTAYRLKSRKLREVSGILDKQTEYAAERLRNAELALEEFRVETVTLPSDQPRITRTPDGEGSRDPVFGAFFDKKLAESQIQAELDMLQDHLEAAREGNLNAVALQLTPAIQNAPALQKTIDELVNLQAERRSLLQKYTREHPRVVDLTQQIEDLRTQAIPSQVQDLIAQKRSELQNLQQQVDSYATQLRDVPRRSIEEARLRRNVEIAEQLYKNLQERQKEAELAASTSVPDLQVVDRAVPPSGPNSNQRPQLFLFASLAGFGLGIAGALLHDRFLDKNVRFPDQITQDLGLPVLGVVPNLKKIGPNDHRNAEVMETFRAVRAHLDRIEPRRTGVVMVTSSGPQEGKSMATANLAIAYAAQGRRVLLIDADTRRGDVEKLFNCAGGPGLTDCLEGRSELREAVQDTPVANLSLLAHGGRQNRFDRDLLDSRSMIRLIREGEQSYDVVIIDTPPLSAGIDSLAIGEAVDKVLLVIRAGSTNLGLAERKLESASRFGLPVVGALLNDVAEDIPFDYYRYYRYDSYEYVDAGEDPVEILPHG